MKILGIGDNVVDFYAHQSTSYPGGNALNVPVLCRRLGATQCSYIGILGTDRAGEHVLSALQEEQINISRVRQAVGPNGEATVSLVGNDRVFMASTGGVQETLSIRLNKQDLDFVMQHEIVHTSVYSHIEFELSKIPVDISFDFSNRHEEDYLKLVCPHVRFAFFSGSDLSVHQCESLMKRASDYGVETVVVTRGAEGAICYTHGQWFRQPAADSTKVIDTLGAGDAFIAGFLVSLLHRNSGVPEALAEGTQSAATTCGYYGAFGYPLRMNEG